MKWDEMSPRERDALVAEKVMGWQPFLLFDGERMEGYFYNGLTTWPQLPSWFTTDISAAWQVVEKMRGDSVGFASKFRACDYEEGYAFWFDGERDICGTAATAPEAICLAALRAVGVDV